MKMLFFLLFLFFNLNFADANNVFKSQNTFMSLKFSEVNGRSGPNSDFPIIFTYKLNGMPVKVLGEFDNWYKVMDFNGDVVWLSKHLVSKSRTVMTTSDLSYIFYDSNVRHFYPKVKVEKNVVLRLIKCKKDRCKIKINKMNGWINKSDIWGY